MFKAGIRGPNSFEFVVDQLDVGRDEAIKHICWCEAIDER